MALLLVSGAIACHVRRAAATRPAVRVSTVVVPERRAAAEPMERAALVLTVHELGAPARALGGAVATVSWRGQTPAPRPGAPAVQSLVTDSAGHARLPGLRAGPYELVVRLIGHDPLYAPIVLLPGCTVELRAALAGGVVHCADAVCPSPPRPLGELAVRTCAPAA